MKYTVNYLIVLAIATMMASASHRSEAIPESQLPMGAPCTTRFIEEGDCTIDQDMHPPVEKYLRHKWHINEPPKWRLTWQK